MTNEGGGKKLSEGVKRRHSESPALPTRRGEQSTLSSKLWRMEKVSVQTGQAPPPREYPNFSA